LVVADSKPSLRRFAQEEATEASYSVKNIDYSNTPFKVEYAVVKLLNRELDLGRSIQVFTNSLSLRKDFNIYDLFDSLDNFKYNFIAKEK